MSSSNDPNLPGLSRENEDFSEAMRADEQQSRETKKEKRKQDHELLPIIEDDEEEDEEEMTTPLYLLSSILFLTGCLFYTASAILWYIYPEPTAEVNFIITCVQGMGAIAYLIEPLVDFTDVLIRANWVRRRNPDVKCQEVICEDPLGLAAAFFFLVGSSLYFWANILALVMIYDRESNPRTDNSTPAPAPSYAFSYSDRDAPSQSVFDPDATTTWHSFSPGPAPSPNWERSQSDMLNDLAAGVFLFDSAIGLVALWQRRRADKGTENERRIICCKDWRDCDFSWWGDWFFFFGAIMECMDLSTWYDPAKNMASCCLWTFDAVFYILDYYSWSEVRCCQLKLIPEERRRSSSVARVTSHIDTLDAPLLGTLSPIAETDDEGTEMGDERAVEENPNS